MTLEVKTKEERIQISYTFESLSAAETCFLAGKNKIMLAYLMNKNIRQIELADYPPQLRMIFDVLNMAGAENYALFGGAARDADNAARKKRPPQINDYDIRVWFSPDTLESNTQAFVEKLRAYANVVETPSAGTGRIRYCMNLNGIELDISVRPVPDEYKNQKYIPAEAVAIDRALDADIGICSVAIDSTGRAWATEEYENDQEYDTLTVYPIADAGRRIAYTARMQTKFPTHKVIWLTSGPGFTPPMPS